jgi:hypothetical protein
MKKTRSAQELVNFFPTWSRIRNSDQSVGFQFLNALSNPIDRMDHYLEKMRLNQYLDTVNLDELAWSYVVPLPETHEFTYDTTDPLQPKPAAPVVRGLVNDNTMSGYVSVSLATPNSVEAAWYEAVPTRVDLEETVPLGVDALFSYAAETLPFSGILQHHLSGGRFWIETQSGNSYVSVNDDGEVSRSRLKLSGLTRKGTYESEELVFPWDMKQGTQKEWQQVTYLEGYDFEDGTNVEIRSSQFDWGPYLSFYNLRWSSIDTKVDEFWDIGSIVTGSTIDRVGYISDEWQNLLLGFSDKAVKDRWELLDTESNSINAVDMAIQPFTERAWIADDTGRIHCFSIEETTFSGLDFVHKRTSGTHVGFEVNDEYYVLGDELSISPVHIRPLQEIDRYRIWYEQPDGTQYGLFGGTLVAITSDFWTYPSKLQRRLEGDISIIADQRGEYKFTLQAVYSDGVTHEERIVVPVKYKTPLTSLDVTPYINGEDISGIDFDSDQQLWIKTDQTYYRFSLHADLMVVDFDDKVIYLRELYDNIEVG